MSEIFTPSSIESGSGSGGEGRIDTMGFGGYWEDTIKPIPARTMIIEGSFSGVTINDTSDHLAPVLEGDEQNAVKSDAFIEATANAIVEESTLLTWKEAGYFTKVFIRVPAVGTGIKYRVYLVDETNPDPNAWRIEHVSDPLLIAGQFVTVATGLHFVQLGTKIRIYLLAYNQASTIDRVGGWDKVSGVPIAGQWSVSGNNKVISIHYTDKDAVDRTAELQSSVPETVFRFVQNNDPTHFVRYRVVGSYSDQGTYINFDIEVLEVGTGGEPTVGNLCDVDWSVPVTASTDYSQISDYWLTNQPSWATFTYRLRLDGVDQGASVNTACGIDVAFQKANFSNDYVITGTIGGYGSSGGYTSVDVQQETLIFAQSNDVSQNPVGIDVKIKVNFSDVDIGDSSSPIQLINDTGGDGGSYFRCNKAGTYTFWISTQVGRVGAAGVSSIFGGVWFRSNTLAPWIQRVGSGQQSLDASDVSFANGFLLHIELVKDEEMSIQIARSGDGNDSGGLVRTDPSAGMLADGWQPSYSSTVQVTHIKVSQVVANPERGSDGRGTTAQRNAIVPNDGDVWMNTERNQIETYIGAYGVWSNPQLVIVENNNGGAVQEGDSVIIGNYVTVYPARAKILWASFIDPKIAGVVVDGDFSVGGYHTVAFSGIYNVRTSFSGQASAFFRPVGGGDNDQATINISAFAIALHDNTGPALVKSIINPAVRF